MTDTLITTAMEQAIGTACDSGKADIERGAIRRFAEAIGDDDPRYTGEQPVAPPTFLRSIAPAIPPLPGADGVPRVLDGGSAWSYTEPVRAGDTIAYTTVLESLTEREGRLGPMLIASYRTDYANQRGATVATQRNTVIRMRADQ